MTVIGELGHRLSTWTGLDLARGVHAHLLHEVIARRAAAAGLTVAAYTSSVCSPQDPEAARLIDFVTVCHSWFFRDSEQLAVVERLLADGPAEMNIWLAACASGEEAYTLAMLADALGRSPHILATDINTEALARARTARYGAWALRTLPASFADRFHHRADGSFEVIPKLRLAVELLRHNLMTPPPPARSTGWHLILCRNVLMYFRPADAEATLARLANALAPGGYLILGASDILAEPPPSLRFVSIGGRYVLQRPLTDESARRATTHPGWQAATPPPAAAPLPAASGRSAPRGLEPRGAPRADPTLRGLEPRRAPAAHAAPHGLERRTASAAQSAPRGLEPRRAPAAHSAPHGLEPRAPAVHSAPHGLEPRRAPAAHSAPRGLEPRLAAPAGSPAHSPPRLLEPRSAAPTGPDEFLETGTRELEAGRFAEAIACFSSAMERDPLSPDAAVLTGVACFLAGDATSALANLRRALVLAPELWQAELYLAMCHERLGSATEATAGYQRLLAMLTSTRRRPSVTGPLATFDAWREDALAIARQKTRRSR